MAELRFTDNLLRHVACPPVQVAGSNLREVMDGYFRLHPAVRGYVLDDQGALRKHMAVFVDGELIRDRVGLSDDVGEQSRVFVFQALSGG